MRVLVVSTFLILVGIFVGAVSIYQASTEGVLGKLGLSKGSYEVEVEKERLKHEFALDLRGDEECNWTSVARDYWDFRMVNSEEERAMMAARLGSKRLSCGVTMMTKGRVRVGMLTMVKGAQYTSQAWDLRKEVCIQEERLECKELKGQVRKNVEMMQRLVDNSKGSVQELLERMKNDMTMQGVEID